MSSSAHVSAKLATGPLSTAKRQSNPCRAISCLFMARFLPGRTCGNMGCNVLIPCCPPALHSTGAAWGGFSIKLRHRNTESPHRPSRGYTRGCTAPNLILTTVLSVTVLCTVIPITPQQTLTQVLSLLYLPDHCEIGVNLRTVHVCYELMRLCPWAAAKVTKGFFLILLPFYYWFCFV